MTADAVTAVSGPKSGACSFHSIVNPCPVADGGGVLDAVGSTTGGVELGVGLGVGDAKTVVGEGVETNALGAGDGEAGASEEEAGASEEQAMTRAATGNAGSVSRPTVMAIA